MLLLAFAVLAVGIIAVRRYELRRWGLLLSVLLLSVIVLGFVMGGFLCPITAVQNVFLKFNTGYPLLFLIPLALSLLMGCVFCGYICPFGAAQELLHVRKWALKLPSRLMKVLSKLRYVVLVYLVVRVLVTGTAILQDYAPFKPLFSWGGTPLTIGVTALFALLSVFIYPPFCQTLCPLGVLLSLVSRFSLFRIHVHDDCIKCHRCTRECPTGAINDGTVDSSECLLCGKCTTTCPTHSLCVERPHVTQEE